VTLKGGSRGWRNSVITLVLFDLQYSVQIWHGNTWGGAYFWGQQCPCPLGAGPALPFLQFPFLTHTLFNSAW